MTTNAPMLMASKWRTKILIAVFVAVVCVTSFVIWLTHAAGHMVIQQSKELTDNRIPELRDISALQMAMSNRASQLYLYYATFDSKIWKQADELLVERITTQLNGLHQKSLSDEECSYFLDLVDKFSASANQFDAEMNKGDNRDWDLLRTYLADAQLSLNTISDLLGKWSDTISQKAQASGEQALKEVNQLTQLQLGFSLAVMLVSAFVLFVLYARLKDQDRLYRLAYFDDLTGLPNRQRLESDLDALLLNDSKGVLFIVQIDRIKVISSTYGHAIADQLIVQIATWIESRKLVSPEHIYRVNSDSFAIIFPQFCELPAAIEMANNLSSICDCSLTLGERSLSAKLSIGIALFSGLQREASAVMRNAVAAITARKQSGHVQVFEPRMTEESERWLSTESALRAALVDNEFELFYQPKVNAKTHAIMSSEALIRWRHAGNLISPAQFIPVAEESGLIVPIGNWVLLEACRQWQAWSLLGFTPLPIAVNISAQQFQDPAFLMQVDEALKRFDVPPAMIELEITEAVAANDPESAVAMMLQLKELGVTLAIDDFGTGYSSLSYLKRFPIDTLKIDIAFVRHINTSLHDQAIASMILALGKQLHLKVVAEGVETQEQQVLLAALGCDILQGYLFSKPLPAAQFAVWIGAVA